VTGLEERLREAYREAGDTVRPETIRALGDRASQPAKSVRPARHGRRATRVLAPLGAAACVAALAITAAAVIPQLAGARGHHTGHTGTTSPPRRSGTSALAALPKFTILNDGSNLAVVATATGTVTGRVAAPPGQAFVEVAGTAGDRVFYAAADLSPQTSCRTFLYRIGLSPAGQPLAPTLLTARQMTGLPTALAASADGSLLAYSVVGCAGGALGRIAANQAIGDIRLLDVASGSVTRQWSYTLSEDYPNDLSLSAAGSLLGYSIYMESAFFYTNPIRVGRVLPTSARPGPDYLRSRVVVHQPDPARGGILSTALNTSGTLIYAITSAADQTLAAYDTSDGQQVAVLHRWPSSTGLGQLSADPAGGFLLLPMAVRSAQSAPGSAAKCITRVINGTPRCQRLRPVRTSYVSIDLATGSMTTLPFTTSGPPASGQAAW
jgi:hypothetical protein